MVRATIVVLAALAFTIPQFVSAQAGAPPVAWQERFGGLEADLANAIATDAAGNAYVVGRFSGLLDGQSEIGGEDAFLRIYSPSGAVLLTRQFGSSSFDEATAVAVQGGDVYVVGRTFGATAPGLPSGTRMGFIHRYAVGLAAGTLTRTFAAQLGRDDGQSDLELYSIAVTSDGGMYVAGLTNGAVGGSSTAGDLDAVIARYEASGDLAWVRTVGTSGRDEGRGVAVGADGSAYLVGSAWDALPGQTGHGFVDAFVRKYDAAGNVIWTSQFGTASYDDATGVIAMDGHVYVVGTTHGVLGVAAMGGGDVYWRKFDELGSVLSTAQFGTIEFEGNAAIAAGPSATFAVSAGTRYGGDQLFVSLRNSDGEAVWERLVAGPLPVEVQFGHNIAVAPTGAIVLCSGLDGGRDASTGVFNWEAFVVGLEAPPPAPTGPPEADAQSLMTPEDTPIAITLSGGDPQGDPLTFAIAAGPSRGALSGTPPDLTYTPGANFNGADSFTFTVSDGSATSEPATVAIAVSAVNDPPTAIGDTATTIRRTPVAIAVLANDRDVDGDVLAVTGATPGSNGTTVVNLDGTVTYTPAAAFTGIDGFSYTIADGRGGTATARVAVTVRKPMADVQVAVSASNPVIAGELVHYTIDVRNAGPQTATNVIMSNTLPPKTSFVSVTDTAVCAGSGAGAGCRFAKLEPDASRRVVITARASRTTIMNRTDVYATEADPDPSNNRAWTKTEPRIPQADLSVTLTDSPDPVAVGQQLTYTAVVVNHGPATAKDASVLVRIDDPTIESVRITPSQGSCTRYNLTPSQTSDWFICALGTLDRGRSATTTFAFKVLASAVIGGRTVTRSRPYIIAYAIVPQADFFNDPVYKNNTVHQTTVVR
jgi:uncharacterized repeat protein (TIGR01451 family)